MQVAYLYHYLVNIQRNAILTLLKTPHIEKVWLLSHVHSFGW